MINVEKAKSYCCEDISKIYGYAEAVADKKNMWHCHHCLGLAYTTEQLKAKGLYYKRPASELMFVTSSQHKTLHCLTNPPKKHYDETKQKMSASRMGHVTSEETRRKISESQKGKHHSNETKQKLRLINTNDPKKSKKVLQFTKDGEFICEYPSTHEALRQLGIVKGGHISDCCKGKRKPPTVSYGGLWNNDISLIYPKYQ